MHKTIRFLSDYQGTERHGLPPIKKGQIINKAVFLIHNNESGHAAVTFLFDWHDKMIRIPGSWVEVVKEKEAS